VAYYPNSQASDPRTFNYGDEVAPEFTYEEGMYITVNCNKDDHSAITIVEDDFYVVPEADLEDCDLVTPDVRVFEATNKVSVTFDTVDGFDSDHYPVSVVAYYPNSHASDPRTFNYGDEVAPEFDYEAGMYIEVKCNKDDHSEIVVNEDDFYWMRTITLHYSGGGQTRTTTVEVGDESPIPEDTYLYTGGGGARYYSDYTWYIDSDHSIVYNNEGVTASFDLYGVRS